MSVVTAGDLFLDNAYAAVWVLQRYDTVTAQYVPLVGATCTLELRDGGSHFVGPVPLPETDIPGTYATTIPAADINTAFAHGPATVREIVAVGGSALVERPLRVFSVRTVL